MAETRVRIRKRKTLTDQLYGQILEQIVSGQLQEGDKLPSEHQICDAFAVSRPVVREALRRLQEDHLIESRRGVGSFVRKRPPQGLIEYASADSVAGLMRAMEARMTVESATARMAAQRADSADLTKISDALDALEQSMALRQPSRDPDFAFHLAVAEASHNEVYVAMLQSAQEVMQRAIDVAQSITRGGSQARVDRVLLEHRQIYEAILSRDAEAAGLSMAYHLLQARQRITDHAREE
ncbi:FadR/GntR family transcriptional regulator [Salipiger mucosus]|uniref:Putative transcription regulator protein n=1 Tax=Salipiger mucosus DSM 16094 TaxID=1123237 RepID=S9RIL9_9RHOB|nr:FadR/GntR family transcriptional regulator [Salipiger mucosus]EPX77965.1 putative transcription regulator protein [Salipiger mucosus DSM 16094]